MLRLARIGGIYELDFSRTKSALRYNNHQRWGEEKEYDADAEAAEAATEERRKNLRSSPDNVFSLNPISIER